MEFIIGRYVICIDWWGVHAVKWMAGIRVRRLRSDDDDTGLSTQISLILISERVRVLMSSFGMPDP